MMVRARSISSLPSFPLTMARASDSFPCRFRTIVRCNSASFCLVKPCNSPNACACSVVAESCAPRDVSARSSGGRLREGSQVSLATGQKKSALPRLGVLQERKNLSECELGGNGLLRPVAVLRLRTIKSCDSNNRTHHEGERDEERYQ